jgi:hypothetical protein
MDGIRVDNLARRLSRRKAIGAVGATGLVVAAGRVLPAAAQEAAGWAACGPHSIKTYFRRIT